MLQGKLIEGSQSEDVGSSERAHVPSLLGLKAERPAKVNLMVLRYMKETVCSGFCKNLVLNAVLGIRSSFIHIEMLDAGSSEHVF